VKAGEVVKIRVNPEDVMGCIDLCIKGKMYTRDMSIAQIVRLSLSGLLEIARRDKIIPTRSGFEYTDMLHMFVNTSRSAHKLQISSIIEGNEQARANIDLPRSSLQFNTPVHNIVEDTPAIKRKKANLIRRQMELDSKKRADPDNFTQADQDELTAAVEEYDSIVKGGA
jgi:hypothetical protein